MGKGRSTALKPIETMLESAFQSQYYGNQLLEAQGYDPSRLYEVAPMDDGIPPRPPANLTFTPFLGAVNIAWDEPPTEDFVDHAVIEVTPPDTETSDPIPYEITGSTGTHGYTILDMEYEEYSIRVKFVDYWELESDWSTPILAKPTESADYRFNLEKARQLGNLTGLMAAINADIIAGENFPENSVRQVALAQPEHPNQLPLIEVDFDQWDVDTIWPPADTDSSNVRYINANIPLGFDVRVVENNARKWLQLTRNAATSGTVVPFNQFRRRGTTPNERYIASAYVQGSAGTRIRFVVEGASDQAGANTTVLGQTDVITLDGSLTGQRVFCDFTVADLPYIRLRLDTVDVNTVSRWSKFQLEWADNKLEPSVWTPGVMSTGVLNARMLTAVDASIANAIFKNAAIQSAAIINLTADKIVAGVGLINNLTVAATLTIAVGGQLVSGDTSFSSNGIQLKAQNTYNVESMRRDSKLTDDFGKSALAFYEKDGQWFGSILRSDGDSSHDGLVALHATANGTLTGDNRAGRLEVLSISQGHGQVRVWQDLDVNRNITAGGDIKATDSQGNKVSLLDAGNHGHDQYVRVGGDKMTGVLEAPGITTGRYKIVANGREYNVGIRVPASGPAYLEVIGYR